MKHFQHYLLLIVISFVTLTIDAQEQDQQWLQQRTRVQSNPNYPTPWWNEISNKPDSWYQSEEALTMADNILSWQHEFGGWPLMNTTREKFTGDVSRAGPWGVRGALVKATYNEIRFLARAYRFTNNEQYKSSALKGLHFILDAQYPTGGWPKSYPHSTNSYSRYATFNDDLMADAITLLRDVVSSPDFNWLAQSDHQRVQTAIDKGIDFILKSQIKVNGKLTAWAQQYDEVTLEPKAARAFEPIAISAGESATVLSMLMSIDEPAPEVVKAIEAAVQWYRDVQIDGYELIVTKEDRVLAENKNAPPLWARFYEIGTNKPIFAGRDGVIKYSMAEIEQERRSGYAWYNYNGGKVFKNYQQWKLLRDLE